jgi:hypothetical protein
VDEGKAKEGEVLFNEEDANDANNDNIDDNDFDVDFDVDVGVDDDVSAVKLATRALWRQTEPITNERTNE